MKQIHIKFEAESIKSSLCDYSDAYTLVTGDITVIDVIQTLYMLPLKIIHLFLNVRQTL